MDSSGSRRIEASKNRSLYGLRLQVIHVDRDSMMVREAEHPMIVHTFTFSNKNGGADGESAAPTAAINAAINRDSAEPVKDEALAIKRPTAQQSN